METTKSKITVNLYGNKHRAEISSSDPDLSDIIQAFIDLLESHDFDREDIHQAMVFEILNRVDKDNIESIYDPASTNATNKYFFSSSAYKKSKK